MAKPKEKAKPLFTLKHDFYASVDNVAQEGIMLIQAIEMALRHGKLPEAAAEILKERCDSFRAALSAND